MFLSDTDDITVVAARWLGDPGPVQVNEWDSLELALPRQGCLSYRDHRGEELVDPNRCLLIPPLQEAETTHHSPEGLLESMVFFCRPVLDAVGVDGADVPLSAAVTPAMQVRHRRLLTAVARRADTMDLQELAIGLLADAVSQTQAPRMNVGRPATARARRDLVEDARLVLNAEPQMSSLVTLAGRLGSSPHHLSRIFHEHTGHTVGEYRTRLRVNLALDHLAHDSDTRSLADVAVRCGFADHAHMTRTVRKRTGYTPQALRALLTV
jgi:AraC-like DNA-binding protein